MCVTPYSGSSKHICGVHNAINVYSTGLKWQINTVGNYYLGCFEESQNNRILDGYSRSFSVNTPGFLFKPLLRIRLYLLWSNV